MTALEASDTQGLVATSFSHLTCAAYEFLRVENRETARTWLRRVIGQVTPAVKDDKPRALNLALSCPGLQAIGLDQDTLGSFPPAFLDGMTSARRTRILGDHGPNEP